jgi:membrane dipeptidase
MTRRDFLSVGLHGAGGAILALGTGRTAFSQNKPDLSLIAVGRKAHPLFFDGLVFLTDDMADLGKSGLSGFIWDVSAVEEKDGRYIRPFLPCLKSIAKANKTLRENDQGLVLGTMGGRVKEAWQTGQTAVFLQFQSCEPFAGDIEVMNVFYELGLRICQVTHHSTNMFGGGGVEKKWTGLTELGFTAVEKMNELGIIPDLSHGNEVLCQDVLKTSKKPVIISHTCCRAIVNNARCAPDHVIKGVADSGGIVGIIPLSFWITNDPVPTVEHYVRHIEQVIRVGGIDAVGIANDDTIAGNLEAAKLNNNNAEAVKYIYPWWQRQAGVLGFDELPKHCVIPELNNVRRHFTIQAALEKQGHKPDEIEKIMGRNWLRVLTQSLG